MRAWINVASICLAIGLLIVGSAQTRAGTAELVSFVSPSGDELVSYTVDGTRITFLDIAKRKITDTYLSGFPIGHVNVSPSGRTVCVTADNATQTSLATSWKLVIVKRTQVFRTVLAMTKPYYVACNAEGTNAGATGDLWVVVSLRPWGPDDTSCGSTGQYVDNTKTYWDLAGKRPKVIDEFTWTYVCPI